MHTLESNEDRRRSSSSMGPWNRSKGRRTDVQESLKMKCFSMKESRERSCMPLSQSEIKKHINSCCCQGFGKKMRQWRCATADTHKVVRTGDPKTAHQRLAGGFHVNRGSSRWRTQEKTGGGAHYIFVFPHYPCVIKICQMNNINNHTLYLFFHTTHVR